MNRFFLRTSSSLTHRAWPFRIMCIASYPSIVRRAALELTKALLGLHSSFDRSMILLQDVVQVLDRSMSAAAAQDSFLFHCCNRRAVEAGLISIDDAGLGVRWIAESLAKQAFGRRSIAQRRQQEVDSGTGGIDGPIEVTPTALHSNIRLIDTPGFVGRLEMTAQPLLPFGTVTLNPGARSSCDPPPDRARRTTLRHRGARASTEDTSARHKESAPAPSAGT